MSSSFVVIDQPPDELRAALLRNVLEVAGIPVILQNRALQLSAPESCAPLQILVPADRVEDARRVLKGARKTS